MTVKAPAVSPNVGITAGLHSLWSNLGYGQTLNCFTEQFWIWTDITQF